MNSNEPLIAPEKLKVYKYIFYAILVVVFVADFLVERHHAAFPWDELPGFGAFYGLISCVLIIIISKFVGHLWLMKKEDYYD